MDVLDLYYRIIRVANFFLENASVLTIQELRRVNPSVAQLAKDMRMLAMILKELATSNYDDTSVAINAFQCCLLMERIADAVEKDDEHLLDELVRQLELHTNVP